MSDLAALVFGNATKNKTNVVIDELGEQSKQRFITFLQKFEKKFEIIKILKLFKLVFLKKLMDKIFTRIF